jgi:hypothetical protein
MTAHALLDHVREIGRGGKSGDSVLLALDTMPEPHLHTMASARRPATEERRP